MCARHAPEGGIRRVLRSSPEVDAASPWTLLPRDHQHRCLCQRFSLENPPKRPWSKNMTEFGAIWDPPQKVRSREVRTWPPLVAISTSRSDLRRSGRLSDIIFRSPPSAIASDDADAISDELAQSGANLDVERIPRARQSVSADINGPRDAPWQLISREYIIPVRAAVGIAQNRPRGPTRCVVCRRPRGAR